MKLLLIGPENWIATDGFIYQGIKNILSYSLGTYEEVYYTLNDHTDTTEFPTEKFDGIIVCGTPWLWDSFQNSIKYKNLLRIKNYHKSTPVIFFGIGTCLNLGDEYTDILKRQEEVEGIRTLFKEATIITREDLAQQRLKSAGVVATLLPCPAFFSVESKYPKGSGSLLIWADPKEIISGDYWRKRPTEYKIIMDFCENWVSSNNAKIVKANKEEPGFLNRYTETLGTRERAIDLISRYENILSLRIHCAIPAMVMGKAVRVVPLDSRYRTTLTGSNAIIENLKIEFDKSEILNKYKEIIMNALGIK